MRDVEHPRFPQWYIIPQQTNNQPSHCMARLTHNEPSGSDRELQRRPRSVGSTHTTIAVFVCPHPTHKPPRSRGLPVYFLQENIRSNVLLWRFYTFLASLEVRRR